VRSRAWACSEVWSGSEVEQLSDEGSLSLHVATADPANLFLPHHCHRLVARQGSSCRSKTAEPKARAGQAFDAPMILLDDVVQVLALP
jgi:hypothetical protein